MKGISAHSFALTLALAAMSLSTAANAQGSAVSRIPASGGEVAFAPKRNK